MRDCNSMIMVVNRGPAATESIKKLIQFMDAPNVSTATPGNWLQEVDGRRLEAVFVGPDLSEQDVESVVGAVGELDPNVPIVMLNNRDAGC